MARMENSTVVESLGRTYLPLDWRQFFADEKAPPNPETSDCGMWFGNELPPTYQEFLRSPRVQQSQMITTMQMAQRIQQSEQQFVMSMDPKQRKAYLHNQMQQYAQQAV